MAATALPLGCGLSRLAPPPQDPSHPNLLSKHRLQSTGDVVVLVTHRLLPYGDPDVRITLEKEKETLQRHNLPNTLLRLLHCSAPQRGKGAHHSRSCHLPGQQPHPAHHPRRGLLASALAVEAGRLSPPYSQSTAPLGEGGWGPGPYPQKHASLCDICDWAKLGSCL